jgi:hypothetical protein
MPSTRAQHEETERLLAEVEIGLGIKANLASPRLLEVSMPVAQPVVPVVDGATDGGKN